MHITDLCLLEIQADALFTHDPQGRICYVNEPDGDRAPRFFFARSREGNLWRFRDDLTDTIVEQLERLARSEPISSDLTSAPRHLDAFVRVLSGDSGEPAVHSGPEYVFPIEIAEPEGVMPITRADIALLARLGWNPETLDKEFEGRTPYIAVIEDDAAVSLCFSSRLTDRVAEAGLETHAAFRGRGYAPRVVAAWARAVRSSGRIPLYSTDWDNRASLAVARKLGLIQYAVDLSLA
jgi:GNAT superfamily N-acetyltransferase